jgi:hypothetical protein
MNVAQELRDWQPGFQPLPEPFEQQALRMFAVDRPIAEWGNPIWRDTRNAYRAAVRQSALETMALSAWTLDTAAPLLAEQSIRLCFGDREIGPAVREEVLNYAESYLEDLWPIVGRPVMSPGGIARNAADLRMAGRKVS